MVLNLFHLWGLESEQNPRLHLQKGRKCTSHFLTAGSDCYRIVTEVMKEDSTPSCLPGICTSREGGKEGGNCSRGWGAGSVASGKW